MDTRALSLTADAGGLSSKVVVSATSAQSVQFTPGPGYNSVLITPDVNVFFRYGDNPTALADGTDMILLASQQYRIVIGGTGKFAFIASGAGNVYLTPSV